VTNSPFKPAEYLKRAREIEATWGDGAATLGVISTFTAELLRPFVIVESEQLGCLVRPWFAPFGQLEQLVLDDDSALWRQNPEVLWIALRLDDVERHLAHECAAIGVAATQARLDAIRARVVALAQAARTKHRAAILVSNFAAPPAIAGSVFDASDPDGLVHLVANCNRQLARDLAQIPGVHVFDYAGAVAGWGAHRWSDPKLWYMARSACSSENMPPLARQLARAVAGLLRPPAKCLVLDLDNTLWGGVLGDDGPQGIKLGDDYPGNVFKDFQAALLGLRERGFLLAVTSKNDEKTVLDALDSHPEMLLKRKHFAAIRANWNAKTDNLREIATALNIGLDSLVFIDDSPVERAAIRAELPMVNVVELPADPLGFLAALADVALFDRPRLLDEDRRRAEIYQGEALRKQVEQQATTVEEFLQGLEMTAQVGLADANTLERIHQLIHKTNQFNLTTTRHPIDELRQFMDSPRAAVAWLRLADRYGDSGLVCVGILRAADTDTWEIDTLLMSCRVMGRQVEHAFLSYLGELARNEGARRLRGIFRPTAKNAPVKDFYNVHGFVDLGGQPERQYEIELTEGALPWPAVIHRVERPNKESARV
jgi:FkbH-like protein